MDYPEIEITQLLWAYSTDMPWQPMENIVLNTSMGAGKT